VGVGYEGGIGKVNVETYPLCSVLDWP